MLTTRCFDQEGDVVIEGEADVIAPAEKLRIRRVDLALRMRFNPAGDRSWFGSVMEIVNSVTMLSIVLTGAALIREREHGTVEHLLVMPVTPFEIMSSKVWAMGLVVLVAAAVHADGGPPHSTVTLFARFLGLSTSVPRAQAV